MMAIIEKEWPKEQAERPAEAAASPRVCLAMPRFYPLFGGHIVQMTRFLPRLQRQGVAAFVATGMVEGDPQTKSARDFWGGMRREKGNGRIVSLARTLAQSWRQTRRFIRQNPSCFRRPSANVDGVDIYRLPVWGPIKTIRFRTFAFSAAWFLIVNRRRYDIIHLVGTSWHVFFSILLAKLLGKKTVVEMVLLGSDDPETIARRRFGRLNLAIWKRADRLASLSPALTESCRRMNVAAEKVTVIPVGVDMAHFTPLPDEAAKKEMRQKLGLPPQGKLVVFVGGIMRRKGVDLLIDAWALVRRAMPDAHLVCVGPIAFSAGSRAFYEAQREKIRALGLSEAITFTGRVEDTAAYYQAADVFTLPSLTEGLPNSALEAMACELPPVMSDIPGISRAIIRSAGEGTVVAERAPEALAAALLAYLQDDGRRKTVGQNARRRIAAAYSLAYRAERYAALYRELLSGEDTI